MTEATARLADLDLAGSLRANVLTVPLLAAATLAILLWKWPRIRTRRSELYVLAGAVAAIAVNNLVPPLIS